MRTSILISIVFGLLSSMSVQAELVETIDAQNCNQGAYKQPKGVFAIYVFCDDALGTNVSIFMEDIGAPFSGKYYLGKRFWQGEEWNYDATSYSWLKDNRLLLATSGIYGSGKIYLLNLDQQTFEIFRENDEDNCLTHLKSIEHDSVTIVLTDCKTLKETTIEIAL